MSVQNDDASLTFPSDAVYGDSRVSAWFSRFGDRFASIVDAGASRAFSNPNSVHALWLDYLLTTTSPSGLGLTNSGFSQGRSLTLHTELLMADDGDLAVLSFDITNSIIFCQPYTKRDTQRDRTDLHFDVIFLPYSSNNCQGADSQIHHFQFKFNVADLQSHPYSPCASSYLLKCYSISNAKEAETDILRQQPASYPKRLDALWSIVNNLSEKQVEMTRIRESKKVQKQLLHKQAEEAEQQRAQKQIKEAEQEHLRLPHICFSSLRFSNAGLQIERLL